MVQVQFDEGPEITRNGSPLEEKSSSFVAWFIRIGVIRNERQGNMLLIGIFVLCVLLSIYFLAKAFRTPTASSTTPTAMTAPVARPR